MRLLLVLSVLLFHFPLSAQDYYLKIFSEQNSVTQRSAIVSTADNNIIHVSFLTNNKILIRRINKCGDQIWAKEIGHATDPMDVVDIKSDTNGNFILAGNLGQFNNGGRPFIMSFDLDGNINFFKAVSLPSSVQSITYSFQENKKGDFYLYFNYNTGGTNRSEISVLKLNPDGELLWFKSFSGMSNWGRASSTDDGGLLFRAGSSLAKMNSDGTIAWSNTYQGLGYVDYPIEVEGGYIFFKYPSGGASSSTNLVKLNDSGKVSWTSNNFENFIPRRGILRKNGNVLYTGSSQGIGLVEVDTSTGSIVRFKTINPSNKSSILTGVNLYEDEKGEVLISGVESVGSLGSSLYLNIDSSLSLPTCSPSDLTVSAINTANIVAFSNTVSTKNQSNQLINILDESYTDTAVSPLSIEISCDSLLERGRLDLGRDTILCPQQTYTIGNGTSSFDDYLWSTGAKGKQIMVSTAGVYSLRVIVACDTLRDTVEVGYYPNVDLFIGADTTICDGDSVTLSSNYNLDNYLWSTGETDSEITVKDAGIYWLESNAVCGKVRDSILINVRAKSQRLELGKDSSICPGASIFLGDSLSEFDNFRWSTGENTPFIEVRDSALYVVEASSLCDTLKDSIRISLHPELQVSFIKSSREVKTFEMLSLSRNDQNAVGEVMWDFGDGEQAVGDSVEHQYEVAGNYTIQMIVTSLEGCEFIAMQSIKVNPSDYFIPNVFSPNNDGINDVFQPVGKDIKSYRLTVYNRWGKEVFSNKRFSWDGRSVDGKKLSSGNYFYLITIDWNYGGSTELKGEFTLLR